MQFGAYHIQMSEIYHSIESSEKDAETVKNRQEPGMEGASSTTAHAKRDSLTAIPGTDETPLPINRLNRWCRVSQYSQNLWKRWSREYLSQLQERSKWASGKGPEVKIHAVGGHWIGHTRSRVGHDLRTHVRRFHESCLPKWFSERHTHLRTVVGHLDIVVRPRCIFGPVDSWRSVRLGRVRKRHIL
eukprot:XP_016660187.1 PREDICTED: uncharacterized protein LOC100165995 [Acyrthosiphon pisum]